MAKDSINIVERHIDKIALALAGVFALAMFWMYMVNSPNRVPYDGQSVGPRQLDNRILESATLLQSKVRNAAPDEVTVDNYSDQLRNDQQESIIVASLRDAGPNLPAKLRLAAAFGKAIVVPGLEESENAGTITLVTPLRPSPPKLSTGRSVAVRTEMILPGQAPSDTDQKKEPQATEFPWLSIAAYWDRQAQRAEMTAAKYAAYRTKVYVAGVDAQRQEMLASGEFSEWKDVPRSKAGVNIPIRNPIFDDQTGAIMNKDRIEQSYRQIKDYQPAIMQPMFYAVELGDDWLIPPIEGFSDEDLEDDEEGAERISERLKRKKERERRKKENAGGRRLAPPVGEGGHGAGDGAIGGGRAAPPPVRVRGRSSGNFDRERKNQAREQIRQDLKDAAAAMKDKDYNLVLNLANGVLNNEYVRAGDEKRADGFIRAADKLIAREERRRGSEDGELPFITHPDNDSRVAVWLHDDSVEPGKTYRYRMRVNLWNRYVGQIKPLRDPQEARHSVLYGDWSLPSEPMAVTPSTYFFLNSPTFDQSGANVDVFKWRKGEWLKQRFLDVQIGKVIGEVKKVKTDDFDDDGKPLREDIDFDTGVVVLDLRFAEPVDLRTSAGKKGEFSYRSQASLVMVYLEPADGQVKQRILAIDRRDPLRKKLQDEY